MSPGTETYPKWTYTFGLRTGQGAIRCHKSRYNGMTIYMQIETRENRHEWGKEKRVYHLGDIRPKKEWKTVRGILAAVDRMREEEKK